MQDTSSPDSPRIDLARTPLNEIPRGITTFAPKTSESTLVTSEPIFCYNPLHDLESVLWLAKFFVIDNDVELVPWRPDIQFPDAALETPADRSIRLAEQSRFSDSLFYNGRGRRWALTSRSDFRRHLHPALGPLETPLNRIRHALYESYIAAEVDLENIGAEALRAAEDVYDVIDNSLDHAIAIVNNNLFNVHVPRSIAQALDEDKEQLSL